MKLRSVRMPKIAVGGRARKSGKDHKHKSRARKRTCIRKSDLRAENRGREASQ